MPGDPILEARGVTRVFAGPRGPVPVLRSLDLAVERGQMVAIMGPSGAGKSTFLHICGGLDLPTRGQVRVDGVELAGLSDAARTRLRREKVSFIFQFFNLIPYLTVRDNILVPNLLGGGQPGRDYQARLRETLAALGLAGVAGYRPDQLAGGEQQRVAIARALLLRPALVLADEPTGNLDYQTGADILHLLWRTAYEWGRTVLLVTHNARSAAYAERVLVLRDGSWLADWPIRAWNPAGWETHDATALIAELQKLGL